MSIGPKRTLLAFARRSASFSSTPRHIMIWSFASFLRRFGTSGQASAPRPRPMTSQAPRGSRQQSLLSAFNR